MINLFFGFIFRTFLVLYPDRGLGKLFVFSSFFGKTNEFSENYQIDHPHPQAPAQICGETLTFACFGNISHSNILFAGKGG